MNISVENLKNQSGGTLKMTLRRSYRKLGKPRSALVASLGSIRVADLANPGRVQSFLEMMTQRLFAAQLSTAQISNLLGSLARRIPAFSTYFENLKF